MVLPVVKMGVLGEYVWAAEGLGLRGSELQVLIVNTWVVVKIMVPFWVLIIIRHLIFRVPKKGP